MIQEYSNKEIERAGDALIKKNIQRDNPVLFRQSMDALSDWRAKHETTLEETTAKLKETSLTIDRKSIIVRRLKRTPSIIKKLNRFDAMKLRNMQDIAGCRSILSTTKNVYKAKRVLNKKREYKIKDYIQTPKPDGYRGIHLIGKFKNKQTKKSYSVEIQLRSKVQHSWATAVEIIDLFTQQALKSNEGKQDWLDFFRHISAGFSMLEGTRPTDLDDAMHECARLSQKLDVYKKFEGYAQSFKLIDDHVKNNGEGYNLITINFSIKSVTIDSFPLREFERATQEYLTAEKNAASKNFLVVALVSSDSIENLKEAYPNYFADSALFVFNLRSVEKKYFPKTKKSFLEFLTEAGFGVEN